MMRMNESYCILIGTVTSLPHQLNMPLCKEWCMWTQINNSCWRKVYTVHYLSEAFNVKVGAARAAGSSCDTVFLDFNTQQSFFQWPVLWQKLQLFSKSWVLWSALQSKRTNMMPNENHRLICTRLKIICYSRSWYRCYFCLLMYSAIFSGTGLKLLKYHYITEVIKNCHLRQSTPPMKMSCANTT